MPEQDGSVLAGYVAPRTPAEQVLAAVWSEVLGVAQVGVHDNFFELGGDSILSIQIITRARQAGILLTPKQLFHSPTVAELAAAARDSLAIQAQQDAVSGSAPLTPIQHWLFEQGLTQVEHYNQALLLEARRALDPVLLQTALTALIAQHDALRLVYRAAEGVWSQLHRPQSNADSHVAAVDLEALPPEQQRSEMARHIAALHAACVLSDGPLLRMAYFRFGPDSGRLFIVCHHLVIDGVSWRILLEDLNSAYHQAEQGNAVALPDKTSSFQQWGTRLAQYAQEDVLGRQRRYWQDIVQAPVAPLPYDFPTGNNCSGSAQLQTQSFSAADTEALLTRAPAAYRTQINDLLLAALACALSDWLLCDAYTIWLEGHGREELFEDIDISRTVGWFTSLYPVRLALCRARDAGSIVKSVKEQLRAVPDNGIGYGLLRHLARVPLAAPSASPAVAFNYLGQIDQALQSDALLAMAPEPAGASHGAGNLRSFEVNINAVISDGALQVSFAYSRARFRESSIAALGALYQRHLCALIAHCTGNADDHGAYTPSDFALAELDQDELDALLNDMN
ncbi:MAG: hypothetical protein NVSMB6_21620 [Burkholderiaceae bacterium]